MKVSIRRTAEEDDSAYTSRQLRGLQALMALAEPTYASRQVRGVQALMALAESEITVFQFSGASARLRYTGPLKRADGRPLERPPHAGVSGRE